MRFEPFGDPFRSLDRLTSQLMSGTRTPMGMPMDVWQAEDGYHVALDLPGVDPGSVEITTERNTLTIRAERRAEYAQGSNVLLAERPQGRFTRQLQVGDALDTEKVQANYNNGVLHLTIPMSEKAQPRRIEVQHDSGQQQLSVGSDGVQNHGSDQGSDQSSDQGSDQGGSEGEQRGS
ncbi:Hsp20/alpha crystallin family protein [Modestobacter lacusdianchii]